MDNPDKSKFFKTAAVLPVGCAVHLKAGDSPLRNQKSDGRILGPPFEAKSAMNLVAPGVFLKEPIDHEEFKKADPPNPQPQSVSMEGLIQMNQQILEELKQSNKIHVVTLKRIDQINYDAHSNLKVTLATGDGEGFSKELRDDHMFYATIMGLLLAASSYLLAWHLGSDKSSDVKEGWYCLLATSIFINLSGILGILVASCCNYLRIDVEFAMSKRWPHFWDALGHAALIAATACALVGSALALYAPGV